jgi:YVTN family beta-propeller protein
MSHPRNFRVYFLLGILAISGLILLLREHRPSFLRPDLHLSAYVTTADGNVTVVDLVKLKAVARIPVGPGLSGMREHPTRAEIYGVSSTGGYVWILDARAAQSIGQSGRQATGQSAGRASSPVTARIPVGPLPYAIDFSPDGKRVYTTSSGSNTLLAIDVPSRSIVARAATGREPVLARVTPDGKSVLVVNRRDGSLGIHDAATLAQRASVAVVAQPEDVAVLPDSSVAFVMSRSESRISVVDLRRGVLITHLELAGKPTDMLLKPDGGELYVISPEAHGLQVINTSTHEVGDSMVLGSAPTRGVLSSDASLLYVSDTASDRVTPVDIVNRRIDRDPGKGFPVPAGDAPEALRFDPAENLLLVVNRNSGDLAIIRVRTNFLVTLIPVGEHPQDLAVKLF